MKYAGARPGRQPAVYVDFTFQALQEKIRDPRAEVEFDRLDIQALLQSYQGLAKTALSLEQALNIPKGQPSRLMTIHEIWNDLIKRANMAVTPEAGSPEAPPS